MEKHEKLYFEREVFPDYEFAFEHDEELIESILKHVGKGSLRVLDLGCGEAGNALKLAELGHEVVVVDISETAIAAVKKEVEKRGLALTALCTDIDDYDFADEAFDIILMTGVLHFLDNPKRTLQQLQERTVKGGLHVVDLFLKGSACSRGSAGYYFASGEILNLYPGWEVFEHERYEGGGGMCEFVIFRKG